MTKLDEFDYQLPKELIAQHPIYPREYARLMVLNRKARTIQHKRFYEIVDYFNQGDVLILNNTKVIRARIKGTKKETKGKREIFLLNYLGRYKWRALVSPNRRTHRGDKILLNKDMYVEVLDKCTNGEDIVRFVTGHLSMDEILNSVGNVPLPPYIKGKIARSDEYQTVFAREDGAVAAPTAGLHFTDELLTQIRKKGAKIAYITLHVGLGTFKPVKEEFIEKHRMHKEEFFIPEEAAYIINQARASGRKLFACGTTVVRALETASAFDGVLKPMHGETVLFIKPGYPFKIVDSIITNFHFPRTTLLMLISAFADRDFILKAYGIAIKKHYRFYSFGDAMLIL